MGSGFSTFAGLDGLAGVSGLDAFDRPNPAPPPGRMLVVGAPVKSPPRGRMLMPPVSPPLKELPPPGRMLVVGAADDKLEDLKVDVVSVLVGYYHYLR